MLRRLLPLLLLCGPAFGQVTSEGTDSAVDTTDTNGGPLTKSSLVMPANTETLLVFASTNANATSHAVVWNTSENLTQVGTTTLGGGNDNTGVIAFCLQSPTITTADLALSWTGNVQAVWMTIHALSGTNSGSCAAVITELAEDVDDAAASSTAVFGSAGSSGDEGFIACSFMTASVTATNSQTWTELFETDTGGGQTGGSSDLSINVTSGDLPAANTITISETDEHACLYMSVAAAASGVIPILQSHKRRRSQ